MYVGLQLSLMYSSRPPQSATPQPADCNKELLDLLIKNHDAAAGAQKMSSSKEEDGENKNQEEVGLQNHHRQIPQSSLYTTSTASAKSVFRRAATTTAARRGGGVASEQVRQKQRTMPVAPPAPLPTRAHEASLPEDDYSISTKAQNTYTSTSNIVHKKTSQSRTTVRRTNPTATRARRSTTAVSITNVDKHKKPFSIQVYTNNDIVSTEILHRKAWETDKIDIFQDYFVQYSTEHDIPLSQLTFVDIGANVGWFTLNMAAFGVNVLAFEPMEENIQLIEQSLALEDNVRNGISDRITLFKHGLGVKDQTCFVYSHNINVGDGHVKCLDGVDGNEDGDGTSSMERELQRMIPQDYSIRGRIPVRRLDDVIQTFRNEKDQDLKVLCVKMDTEGYEGNVLEGGKEFLLNSGVDIIITEFVPQWITEKGGDPFVFMTSVKDSGYRIVESGAHGAQYKSKYISEDDMIDTKKLSDGELILHSPSYVQVNTLGM